MVRVNGFALFQIVSQAAHHDPRGVILFSVQERTLTVGVTNGNGSRARRRFWVFWEVGLRNPVLPSHCFSVAISASAWPLFPACDEVRLSEVLTRNRRLKIETESAEILIPCIETYGEAQLGLTGLEANLDDCSGDILGGIFAAEAGNAVLCRFADGTMTIYGPTTEAQIKLSNCVSAAAGMVVEAIYEIPALEWFRLSLRIMRIHSDGRFLEIETPSERIILKGDVS